jgi:hypothetical protein
MTNFVRGFHGLSPSEKAAAFVPADHEDQKAGGSHAAVYESKFGNPHSADLVQQ